jgi:ABC-type branched-subunit amino acid transport system substrate-binding protein
VLLFALALAGCGGGGGTRTQVPDGGALTIYTSLPGYGSSARTSSAVAAGERLALSDHGPVAGGRQIRLVQLESGKPDGDTWDPALVEKNAETAAADSSTIAYLGELDQGASAISLPVTNAKGILQLSPFDGLTSLTRDQPGGPRGGPERYYPGNVHTFARLVPTDLAQAATLFDWARDRGARKIAIVHDDRLFGRAIAGQVTFLADSDSFAVTSAREIPAGSQPADWAGDVRAIANERPDAVIYAGLYDPHTAPLLVAVQDALPSASLYAAGIGPDQQLDGVATIRLVSPERPLSGYGSRARGILERLGPGTPVAALYGYESMRLALAAIDRAGPNRVAVAREALRAGTRDGALGVIGFTSSGDVADQRLAAYRRDGSRLTFEAMRMGDVPPPAPATP